MVFFHSSIINQPEISRMIDLFPTDSMPTLISYIKQNIEHKMRMKINLTSWKVITQEFLYSHPTNINTFILITLNSSGYLTIDGIKRKFVNGEFTTIVNYDKLQTEI